MGSRYPFLTSKERDNETGLDYFIARYYSPTQGRFTSPDEFTGGPDELYYFVDDASDNPTFYADLRRPQSLNKYQYSYNNPLRYIDPDGHDPEEPEPPQDPRPVLPLPPIPGMPPLVVPGGSTTTSTSKAPNDATIIEGVKRIWELPDPYLYPISQTIGTAPDPVIAPVPITEVKPVPLPTTGTLPQTTVQPQARPEPVQSRSRGRSRGRGNQKDTGLRDKSDADVAKGARDRSLPKAERQRYKKRRKPEGKGIERNERTNN